MPSKRPPKKGDIVYCNYNGEVVECVVMEVSRGVGAPKMCLLEVVSQPGNTIVACETEFCNSSQAAEVAHEIAEQAAKMWDFGDVDINDPLLNDCTPADHDDPGYFQALMESEPPEDVDPEQNEYNLLCNGIGSVGSIIAMLLEFADSEKRIGEVGLLALRDKAEDLGADDIRKAIDNYIAGRAEDIELGYDPDR